VSEYGNVPYPLSVKPFTGFSGWPVFPFSVVPAISQIEYRQTGFNTPLGG